MMLPQAFRPDMALLALPRALSGTWHSMVLLLRAFRLDMARLSVIALTLARAFGRQPA